MNRSLAVPLLLVVLLGCPGDDDTAPPVRLALDTVPVNLDTLQTSLPPTVEDTLPRVQPEPAGEPREPREPRQTFRAAPPALMEVVRREQEFTRFCYQEFGQKMDPQLTGEVVLVVTAGREGVTAARVADDSWSGRAGEGVNRCIVERAPRALSYPAGTVPAGRYEVRMQFRPS